MNRLYTLIIVIVVTGGCAIIDDAAEADKAAKRFNPIEEDSGMVTTLHGIVTVDTVHQRSDIVVLPPTIQHVVWYKHGAQTSTATYVGEAPVPPPNRSPADVAPVEAQTAVQDNWPLLGEDLNFESEIGRLDMCRTQITCHHDDRCLPLEPCTNPSGYECFTTKQGEYCLEVQK